MKIGKLYWLVILVGKSELGRLVSFFQYHYILLL
jgi:hypothetical protein